MNKLSDKKTQQLAHMNVINTPQCVARHRPLYFNFNFFVCRFFLLFLAFLVVFFIVCHILIIQRILNAFHTIARRQSFSFKIRVFFHSFKKHTTTSTATTTAYYSLCFFVYFSFCFFPSVWIVELLNDNFFGFRRFYKNDKNTILLIIINANLMFYFDLISISNCSLYNSIYYAHTCICDCFLWRTYWFVYSILYINCDRKWRKSNMSKE